MAIPEDRYVGMDRAGLAKPPVCFSVSRPTSLHDRLIFEAILERRSRRRLSQVELMEASATAGYGRQGL